MTNLGDALQGAFAAHEAAERGRVRDPHRTVRSIRRRRVAYAAGTGSAAAVAVGAIVLGGTQLPRFAGVTPGGPTPTATGCVNPLYLPPNPGALGDADIEYRSYVDLRPDSPDPKVVVVALDGTVTEVTGNPTYGYAFGGRELVPPRATAEDLASPSVTDWYASGTGTGDQWDGASPFLQDYNWTTVIPDDVPAGVDTVGLSSFLRIATGMGGVAFNSAFVPAGATVDAVVVTTDGTDVTRLAGGDPMPETEGVEGLRGVELRIAGLPGDATFTITSTYAPIDALSIACPPRQLAPSEPAVSPTSATPDPLASAWPDGPQSSPLGGPESAVYACGAALRPELEGTLGLEVSWNTGAIAYEWAPGNDAVAYGAGGVLAVGALPDGPRGGAALGVDGWAYVDDGTTSLEAFSAAVAVLDGVIIGVVPSDVSVDAALPSDRFDFWPTGEDTGHVVAMVIPNLDARMRACDGVDPADLEGADQVLLLGSGPLGGPYQFAWTPIERP